MAFYYFPISTPSENLSSVTKYKKIFFALVLVFCLLNFLLLYTAMFIKVHQMFDYFFIQQFYNNVQKIKKNLFVFTLSYVCIVYNVHKNKFYIFIKFFFLNGVSSFSFFLFSTSSLFSTLDDENFGSKGKRWKEK